MKILDKYEIPDDVVPVYFSGGYFSGGENNVIVAFDKKAKALRYFYFDGVSDYPIVISQGEIMMDFIKL